MKLPRRGYVFITLLLLSTHCKKSCDTPCNCPGPAIVCVKTTDNIQFQYTSQDGTNLLGGAGKKYEFSDFGFFTMDKNNQKYPAILNAIYAGYQNDTIVGIVVSQLSYSYGRSFLEVKSQVQDTVDLTFVVWEPRCCGKVSTIVGTKLNGFQESDPRKLVIHERP